MELLQELRVAQTGVQILFAFLLTLPFTQRFSQVTSAQRGVYLATVILSAAAGTLLIAPFPITVSCSATTTSRPEPANPSRVAPPQLMSEHSRGTRRATLGAAAPAQRTARVASSERELKAFLSSVMRGGLNEARQVVVEVSTAREALTARRRLIIIRYGHEPRMGYCQALLDEVGLRAKYADAADPDDLRSVLQLTLEDEIIRALRGVPDMGRLTLIQQLGQASRGRCVARWQGPRPAPGRLKTRNSRPRCRCSP